MRNRLALLFTQVYFHTVFTLAVDRKLYSKKKKKKSILNKRLNLLKSCSVYFPAGIACVVPGCWICLNPLRCDALWRGSWILQSDGINTQNLQAHLHCGSLPLTPFAFPLHLVWWIMCLFAGGLARAPLCLRDWSLLCVGTRYQVWAGGHHSASPWQTESLWKPRRCLSQRSCYWCTDTGFISELTQAAWDIR